MSAVVLATEQFGMAHTLSRMLGGLGIPCQVLSWSVWGGLENLPEADYVAVEKRGTQGQLDAADLVADHYRSAGSRVLVYAYFEDFTGKGVLELFGSTLEDESAKRHVAARGRRPKRSPVESDE